MKKKVGDYDVLDSGTIVGNVNEPIDFIIDESADFIVRLIFIDDDKQENHSRTAEKYGERGVQMTFINYNNSLGTGNGAPLKLGHFNGRELFLNFRVYPLLKAGKHIHYTWLLGKELSHG